jgi:hypothetical protein
LPQQCLGIAPDLLDNGVSYGARLKLFFRVQADVTTHRRKAQPMNRRDFLMKSGVAAAVPASLRSGARAETTTTKGQFNGRKPNTWRSQSSYEDN